MRDVITLLFSQEFLLRALIVGALISLCAALLGVSLVLKRFSMIGDGLSHVAFGAMAIACAANIAPLYFALPIVTVSAFLLLRMSEKGRIKGDAAIALISTGALAVGVLVTSLTTGMNVDIYNYMFGSILTMSDSDVTVTVILSAFIFALFIAFYHEIFAVTFDESFARATGTRASFYNSVIAVLTAVTIVIGMRMMGALLISSLIIFPTVTSMRICKSYKRVVISSVLVSLFCFIVGLVLSVKYEAPTGAAIVIVNIFMLAAFSLVRAALDIPENHRMSKLRKPLVSILCLLTAAVLVFIMSAGDFTHYKKDRLTVVATTFAPYDFARELTNDKAELHMLLSPGEESHTYEPTPDDILKIQQCDIFIYGGGESDAWVDRIISSVEGDIITVRMMDTVQLCTSHEHEHEHTHSEDEHSYDIQEYDEHVWTSPLNAVKICDAICEALCRADGENADFYKERNESYKNSLSKLDSDFTELISKNSNKQIIIGDRFPLLYFANRYSLSYQAAFSGCSAHVEANPVRIAELCDAVEAEGIPYVFKIDLSTGNVAETIASQTGAKTGLLYSCHVISDEDFKGGETYLSLMRKNLEALRLAFDY